MNRYQTNPFDRLGAWLRRQLSRRPKPVWALIAMDVLLIGVSLLVFALFHHVLPRSEQSVGRVSSRASMSAPAAVIREPADAVSEPATAVVEAPVTATETGEGEAVPASAPAGALAGDLTAGVATGDFSRKFAGMFTDGEVIQSASGYKSANVNVALNRYEQDNVVFYVADIYVRDISNFVTAFAKDKFAKGVRENVSEINRRVGGVIAVNGDYYGARSDGIVIRNGELYRSDNYPVRDVCVLYWDGTMETFSDVKFVAEDAIDAGAYQAWNFGPELLDSEGRPMTKFNSDVYKTNPRTALGYFEPGHYCFVVVDGRQSGSNGLTLTQLSALMAELGCVRAYNLDGGNTSVMVAGNGETINHPSGGGRATSDIIAIVDSY